MDVPHYNLSLQDFVCDVEQLIGLETYITGNREKIDAQSVSIFSQITVKTWLLGCKDTVQIRDTSQQVLIDIKSTRH